MKENDISYKIRGAIFKGFKESSDFFCGDQRDLREILINEVVFFLHGPDLNLGSVHVSDYLNACN